MYRALLPDETDLVIVSYGGVGTTFLLDFLGQYKKTNDLWNRDKIKHSPLPPVGFNPNLKFIYVYGSPQMAVASLFRRDYHPSMSRKLQRWYGNTKPLPLDMTLDEYAAAGVDSFYFERHFFNWYESYLTGIPTLFVRYETLFDNVQSLLEFVGLPETIANFPRKTARNSLRDTIPTHTLKALDQMYGEFAVQLKKLSDVEVRQSQITGDALIEPEDIGYRRELSTYLPHKTDLFLQEGTPTVLATVGRIKWLRDRFM